MNLKRVIPCTIFVILLLGIAYPASSASNSHDEITTISNDFGINSAMEGYVHRPVFETFVGLSCPPCMKNAKPVFEKLWDENKDKDEVPFHMIDFHVLAGGGVDDLATDETIERMVFYQPGAAFAPEAEIDGGYVKLGGASPNEISDANVNTGLDSCNSREDVTINPRQPIRSLLNGFKFVNVHVSQFYTGDGFSAIVNVEYTGTTAPVGASDLNGILYVFMVEQDVEAFSTVLEETVVNPNVFRGYAIKEESFSLSSGDSQIFAGEWKLPTDALVPVKPGDVQAIAVIYDADDTSSEGTEGWGNNVGTPRALNSASARSTAFDLGASIPIFGEFDESYSNDEATIEVQIDHEEGIISAFVVYNYNATNATDWSYADMELVGDPCDLGDTCIGTKNPLATGIIPAPNGQTIYYRVLAYGAESDAVSSAMNYTAVPGKAVGTAGGDVSAFMPVLAILVLGGIGFMVWKRRSVSEIPVDPDQREAETTPTPTPSEPAAETTSS